MKNSKGQASIEMLAMTGIAIAFILPLAILFLSSSNAKTYEISKLQAQALGQRISDEVGKVCYQGQLAKRVVLVSYPDRMLNLGISGREITITLEGERGGLNQIVVQSPCNMTEAITSSGFQAPERTLSYLHDGRYVSSGLVALVFFNTGDKVNIYRVVDNHYYIS